MDLAWTRLGPVPADSSHTEFRPINSLQELSTERKRNGRDLARHKHLKIRGTCFPIQLHRVQAVTRLHVLINLEVYLHNGRKTEGERKGTEGITSSRYEIRQTRKF